MCLKQENGGEDEEPCNTEPQGKKVASPKLVKPDSPGSGVKRRKAADESPPPLTALKGSGDPSEYLEQDLDDMPDPPDSPDLKIETGDGNWVNEDGIPNYGPDGLGDLGMARFYLVKLDPVGKSLDESCRQLPSITTDHLFVVS